MAAVSLSRTLAACKFLKIARPSFRQITTSQRKKKSTDVDKSAETVYKKVPDFSKPSENKNWLSYGSFDKHSDDEIYLIHLSVFCMVALILGVTLFSFAYYPDKNKRDWAHREAFIRLYEREQLGLNPIDPNYVDPSTIILPPDSELEEDEIII